MVGARWGAVLVAAVTAGSLPAGGLGQDANNVATVDSCTARVEQTGTFTDDDGTEYTRFRLFIEVSDAALTNVYALYGTAEHPLIVPPAYQVASPFGADFGGVNPALFAANPTAEYDSWLTIGLDDGDPRSDHEQNAPKG